MPWGSWAKGYLDAGASSATFLTYRSAWGCGNKQEQSFSPTAARETFPPGGASFPIGQLLALTTGCLLLSGSPAHICLCL